MLVMDEFVDVWYIHKTEYDYVNHFAMVEAGFKRYGRKGLQSSFGNLIFYRNEVSETAQERGIRLTGQMTGISAQSGCNKTGNLRDQYLF